MAKSDIILENEKVSLKAADIDVDFERQFTIKGREVKVHSLVGVQLEDPVSASGDSKAHLSKTGLKISSKGNSANLTSSFLRVNTVASQILSAPEFNGKEIKLGNERDDESIGADGKITLTDQLGKSAIVLEMVKQGVFIAKDYDNSPQIEIQGNGKVFKTPQNVRDIIKPGVKIPNRIPDLSPTIPSDFQNKNTGEPVQQTIEVKPELRINWGDHIAKLTSTRLDINHIQSESISAAKITIAGYGDLVNKIKELEEKIRKLESVKS